MSLPEPVRDSSAKVRRGQAGSPQGDHRAPKNAGRRKPTVTGCRPRPEAAHSGRPTRSILWTVSRAELETLIELQRELAALHSWTRPGSQVGRPRQGLESGRAGGTKNP
jgi:hypothetical protein